MAEAVLSVCWKDHTSELATGYKSLFENNFLVDCTLSAEGQSLKAHRLVLSACSPYFHMLFREETGQHPYIILLNASFEILKSLIDFVYGGEAQIPERNLKAFLALAQSLQIKGLNAFFKNYKKKNHSSNATENSSEGLSEDNQDSCEVESVRTSCDGRSQNYCHQRPSHSHGYQDVVHTSSSLAFEENNASCEEVQSPQEDECLQENNEIYIQEEMKREPLSVGFLETESEMSDNFESTEPIPGNYISEMDGRSFSILGTQHLNLYTGCTESTPGNMETSVMLPSQQQLLQLSNELSSGQNVPERNSPLLPTHVEVPKIEYVDLDDEESDKPMDDPDVQGNDSKEADGGMDPAHGEQNADQCLNSNYTSSSKISILR